MERRIEFRPAFDRRDSDPKKDYGVHGVDLAFYLVGDEGVVQFVLFTNWHLPHVQQERDEAAASDAGFLHLMCHPMPADLGYHSRVPRYEGQTAMSGGCRLLNGPCYYDGSSLNAQRVYEILLEKGDAGVWAELEDYYREIFETRKEHI